MPLFFFDFTQNDTLQEDTVGQELADEKVAQREAVKALAEIAAEEIPRDGKLVLAVTVRKENGEKLVCARLTFEPAV